MGYLSSRLLTAAFIGQQEIQADEKDSLKEQLRNELSRLITVERYRYFMSSGVPGFDALAAQVVLELRETFDIGLFVVLPCDGLKRNWSAADQEAHQSLLDSANYVRYTSFATWFDGCLWRRDKYMVDHASLIITCQPHRKTVKSRILNYAKTEQVPIIYFT